MKTEFMHKKKEIARLRGGSRAMPSFNYAQKNATSAL